jgi:hypothetical protein
MKRIELLGTGCRNCEVTGAATGGKLPLMAPQSKLGRQIAEVVATLDGMGLAFALIGGLALAPHGVIRATQDVDLLVDGEDADAVEQALRRVGYRCIHRSADAGNYQRADERVDVLYATRPIARHLLAAATAHDTAFGALRVVGAEGLIGFKLQALVNDPRRTQDLEDIRALLRTNRDSLDLAEVRGYFRLFDREALLDGLLDEPP